MKVAVIMGGSSAEKDVSIKTGEAVVRACLANGFEAVSYTHLTLPTICSV